MNNVLTIMTIFFLLNSSNVFASDADVKVKKKNKSIFKTLTRKSLDSAQALNFLSEYVIVIDEKNGVGLVTYYFDDMVYKVYKNFVLISINNWTISRNGTLSLHDNNNKNYWKIQPSNKNTINIKKRFNSFGQLYEFSYKVKQIFI
tara:strand:+ start:1146 stop:1583 length:438 start_codon:yes stop_codon:yes gene_type:complete